MNTKMIVEFITYLLTSVTTGSKSNSKSQHSPSSPTVSPKAPSLEEIDGYYIWQKGQKFKLSEHFSTSEMSCKCSYPDCKDQTISKDLIGRLEKVRTEVSQPLVITSAFRCSAYQAHLRASAVNTVVAKKSTHEAGDAVDVVPKNRKMEGFEDICAKQFDSIGTAGTFLHLDIRKGYRRWIY